VLYRWWQAAAASERVELAGPVPSELAGPTDGVAAASTDEEMEARAAEQEEEMEADGQVLTGFWGTVRVLRDTVWLRWSGEGYCGGTIRTDADVHRA
jgi:hypothetical protein